MRLLPRRKIFGFGGAIFGILPNTSQLCILLLTTQQQGGKMSEQEHQPQDTSKRSRATKGTRRTGRKQAQQVAPDSAIEQKPVAPLVPPASDNTVSQSLLPPVASTQPTPNKPPVGEKWGEFPPAERQAELKKKIEEWKLGHDLGKYPWSFIGTAFERGIERGIKLTGADVYWLAAFVAGAGDVGVGIKELDDGDYFGLTIIYRADLRGAHLEGAYLQG